MPTYLMTVQAEDFRGGEFSPQIRLRRFQQEEVFQHLAPGRRVHLRRPDGTRESTTLEHVSVEGLTRVAYSAADEATLLSFPTDPVIRLKFKLRITDAVAPPGTVIWLVD
ncbi:MAG TPA: hypothetical protein VFA26_07865 [Gemmataceae bacterium]|nr:hypothetical protein [Gemmataceae bacterium]